MAQLKHKKWLFSILAVLVFVPSLAFAQGFQTGTLSAVVKDQSGAALPGVTITVTSEERGTQRTGVTESNGVATFPVLPLGFYKVEATLAGFNTSIRTNNKVESEKNTEVAFTLALAAASETITVTGQQPVVDRTNVSANTQISTKEFEKAPVTRGYQNLALFAPGVVLAPGANPNPQVHGAQSTGNVFLFDGVDTTDTVTGTFGANLNFEAIQEVSIQTAGESAEYGRASGAIMNVITKSGTNKFEGSAKSIQTNDKWNANNTTRNEVTGASLARTRANHNNYDYAATLGGPIWRDHVWFFGAYETQTLVAAARQTTVTNENYVSKSKVELPNYRITAQLTPTQTIWAKYNSDPLTGLIRDDYWTGRPGDTTELFALTAQDQGGNQRTAQYSGIFGSSITAEAMYAENRNKITVAPYRLSPLTNGAPHLSLADGLYYNGATFDGFVARPRDQAVGALSYFATLGGNSHNFKAGVDWQSLKSSSFFKFPNGQLYIDESFDPSTRTFVPAERLDFINAPSTSTGKIMSVYARDKFDVSRRLFVEVGLRYENETSKNDVGTKVLDTTGVAPRLQATYDLLGDGRTILGGTAGRFYQSVVLNFADSFANVPQLTNYDDFLWDPSTQQYVAHPAGNNRAGANGTQPNLGLDATYLDEVTAGVQQQLGPTIGVGVRGVYRKWHNLIDTILTLDANDSAKTAYANNPAAHRDYKGVEFSFEKRFAHNWNLLANYTYSQTRGNHFGTIASQVSDFNDQTCVTTVDPTIGDNGSIPCSAVNAKLNGRPTWDIPHVFNLLGAYAFHLGPVSLTAGGAGTYQSGASYSKTRTLTVLNNAGESFGTTATYFYDGQGSDRLPNWWNFSTSLEATYRIFGVDLGGKLDVFNIFNRQSKVAVNNTTWCDVSNPAAGSSCATAIQRYGTATARGSYLTPRNFQLTALIRF